MYKVSEYVSPGHPDKCADYISEYILDRYIEKDPGVRYAVEVMIKGNMVHLAGEVTSTVYFGYGEYKEFVKQALREIGYTEDYYEKWGGQVINPANIEVQVDITAQSPEIGQGVDNDGWGDQGIFFGYADITQDDMMPLSHSLAKSLCYMLYMQSKESGIGGLDIKTEIVLDKDGYIEKIIAAVPCRSDAEYEAVMNSIEDWLEKWYETVPDDSKPNTFYSPEIILNGTGNYVMHGPIADCGVTGRKLAVDFYGGEFQVGGGSPWTKDSSKADLTLNLLAREMAKTYAKNENCSVKVSIACCIGRSDIDYAVETPCGDEITHGKMNASPKELIEKYCLNKPVFTSTCTFGLFGKFQGDKEWEK